MYAFKWAGFVKRRCNRFTADLAHRAEGMAAIEFAMIAPLLVVMWMGTVEFGQAITLDRRVTLVASATADLIAQTDQITDDDLNQVISLGSELMRPALVNYYDENQFKITLISVRKDTNDEIKVDWSFDENGGESAQFPKDQTITPSDISESFDPDLIEESAHQIIAKVKYKYVPTVTYFIGDAGIELEDVFFLSPRKGSVVKTDD